MFECKICGRKFKTMQELGGHNSSAHPKQESMSIGEGGSMSTVSPDEKSSPSQVPAEKVEATEQPTSEAAPSPQPPPAPLPIEEPSEAEQIRYYRKRGLTFKQLTTELGFKPSTVREVIAKELVSESEAEEEKSSALPMVIKNGKGEMIAPEAVCCIRIDKRRRIIIIH